MSSHRTRLRFEQPRLERPRLELLLLTAILLLAAGLRFYWLDGSSLWSDEGNTRALVQRSVGEIARDAAADIHPPGYYLALKLWTNIFGLSVAALRSFSAVAGVALVFVIYRLGLYFDQTPAAKIRWTALLAALLAALNPFQIYYSQEARMYMLLALEAGALFWALFGLMQRPNRTESGRRRWVSGPAAAFVAAGSAGLWTHYSFPIVLAAAGLTFLVDWLWRAPAEQRRRPAELGYFALLCALIVLSFLPWLPTAVNRILAWPQGGAEVSLADGMLLTLRTLLFGPLRSVPAPLWPWLAGAALLPIAGGIAWRKSRFAPGPALWLLGPIGLMFGLGLFSDAFLKFLLVASAPWCLLSAAAGDLLRPRWPIRPLIALLAIGAALLSLPGYYGAATARDNYAGVARYIAATGDPARDLVLLNAPGQQEVWQVYDPGVPTLALPAQRPADPAATEAALAAATADKRRVYALFWATDEADPAHVVENWLDQNAFKGLESWQGNLRFVTYALADEALICTPLAPPLQFGDSLALDGWCLAGGGTIDDGTVEAGDTALITLQWRALSDLDERYKVSVQLLDGTRQVIAQHDSEPAGGARPTTDWVAGETVRDNHGLFIPPGTPPAPYRISVALYAADSGARLPTAEGDAAELGELMVTLPTQAPPLAIIDRQVQTSVPLGPVTLVGYNQHKRGFAHAPATPLAVSDTVEFVFYWQAPDPLPADWPVAQTFMLKLGDEQLISPLAGAALPTAAWQPGQLIRVTVQLPYDGRASRAELSVNEDLFSLAPLK